MIYLSPMEPQEVDISLANPMVGEAKLNLSKD